MSKMSVRGARRAFGRIWHRVPPRWRDEQASDAIRLIDWFERLPGLLVKVRQELLSPSADRAELAQALADLLDLDDLPK